MNFTDDERLSAALSMASVALEDDEMFHKAKEVSEYIVGCIQKKYADSLSVGVIMLAMVIALMGIAEATKIARAQRGGRTGRH